MRFSKLFVLAVSILAVMTFSSNTLMAQTEAFAIQLMISDASTGSDTLYCGWTNNASTTHCTDLSETFNVSQFGVTLSEYELPPLPPDGVFDARFIDSRSGAGACLGQGIPSNFHASLLNASTTQKDTFRVKFQGSVASGGALPYTISWTLPENAKVQPAQLTLRYTDPDDGPVNIDMTSSSSTQITKDGIDRINIYFTGTVGIKPISDLIPEAFALNKNYPNPFNPTTSFTFALQRASDVSIVVYDMLGREVTTLLSERLSAGTYPATWNAFSNNGTSVASGTYYIRMNARYVNEDGTDGEYTAIQKVLLMK